MSNPLYLCIDQGGHASRAMVFNSEGQLVAGAYGEVATRRPRPDFVELDPDGVLGSIRRAVEQVIRQLGDQSRWIAAAGLATQRSNVVGWDRYTGRALSPIISWQDRRNTRLLETMADKNGLVHRRTGLFLSPHYGASKLRWMLDELPQVQQALVQGRLAFGPMSSFISYHLLAEKPAKVDPVNASRTLLWSLKRKDWDPELLDLFAIPRAPLPQCVPTNDTYGHLDIGELTTPLGLVTGDQAAALYAYGQLQPDTAYINIGTGAFVSRPIGTAPRFSRRLLTSIVLQNQTQSVYVLEGTVNGAGSALDWLLEREPQADLFENLPRWLADITDPPLFYNGVSGLAAPFWRPDFDSGFSRPCTFAEKAVAIVESIAFLLRCCLDEMHKVYFPAERIQLSGGLGGLDRLGQTIADLSGLPVYRPAQCEATARGTAYLLAGCPRRWPEQETGRWFAPGRNRCLQERFARWLEGMLQRMRTQAPQ